MSVDLADLVPSLRRALSPPGVDSYADVPDPQLVGYLLDAFWQARMFGFFPNYGADEDGIIVPISGTDDLSRQEQQMVVILAAIGVMRNTLINLTTVNKFRAKAGPVEFETESQNSANVLSEALKQLQFNLQFIYDQLGSLGTVTDRYIDALSTRDESLRYGGTQWWN